MFTVPLGRETVKLSRKAWDLSEVCGEGHGVWQGILIKLDSLRSVVVWVD